MKSFIVQLGSFALESLRSLGGYSLLLSQAVRCLFDRWPRLRVLLDQMYRIGNASVPVVLTTGLFTGMVLAVQTYSQFRRVEMENMVGAVVLVSMVKELGPVLTGLMLAGRVGASMAAEIGTMKVTEQIDALRSLATDPVRHLVLPRFVSCVLLMPVLTIMANFIGIIGGYFVAVRGLSVDEFFYINNSLDWLKISDVVSGLVKSACFGALICVVCCYRGFNAGAGAEGVGKATTQAVVTSCIMILLADFFLTLAMF
jgi:phospholipid/cholesterol/gamma-HCH transport system permease protein